MRLLKKKQGLITRVIDDECMILNPEDGYMHLLNTSGKEVWELLDSCSTLEELVESMYSRYDGNIGREILRDDINEILDSIKEHKLVMEQDNSSSGSN